MVEHLIAARVGRTRLIELCSFDEARIFIKLEGDNPTGSIKDRACLNLIREQRASGTLKSGMTLLDASSGNMACALAYFGRLLGFPTTVVVSSKLTTSKREFLEIYGAEIITIGDFTIDGNRYCRRLIESESGPNFCFLDQLHSWANPQAYFNDLGPEIKAACPEIALLIGPLGSGGSLFGTGSYLKQHLPDLVIIPVQAAKGTKLPGVGGFDDGDYVTPFIEKGYADGLFAEPVKISQRDALIGNAFLRDMGFFCGPSTGGALSAALVAVKVGHVRGNVVILSGDTGWKNMDRLREMDTANSHTDPMHLYEQLIPRRN